LLRRNAQRVKKVVPDHQFAFGAESIGRLEHFRLHGQKQLLDSHLRLFDSVALMDERTSDLLKLLFVRYHRRRNYLKVEASSGAKCVIAFAIYAGYNQRYVMACGL